MIRIPLNHGKVALIDDDDYEAVSERQWHAWESSGTYYAVSSKSGKNPPVMMHRLIMKVPPKEPMIDHVNGDGLDNRKANLRLADNSINQQNRHRWTPNTSGYRGVTFHKRCSKWQAGIKKMGRQYHLGLHLTREDAARAYDEAARSLYGPQAKTNFPLEAA